MEVATPTKKGSEDSEENEQTPQSTLKKKSRTAEKLKDLEDDGDKKISATDDSSDECTEVDHDPERWSDFKLETNKGYFKANQRYYEVGCAVCGKEPHSGRAKWKNNADTFDFGPMAQIRCCTRSPRNHCPFYVCSACFFQHKK